MLSGRTYRTFALLGVFLVVAVQSLPAMSCTAHMKGHSDPEHMTCCNESASDVIPLCPLTGSMNSGSACTCQSAPASQATRKAVVPARIPAIKVFLSAILAGQNAEPNVQGFINADPPDLHPDVPIFLKYRSLLI